MSIKRCANKDAGRQKKQSIKLQDCKTLLFHAILTRLQNVTLSRDSRRSYLLRRQWQSRSRTGLPHRATAPLTYGAAQATHERVLGEDQTYHYYIKAPCDTKALSQACQRAAPQLQHTANDGCKNCVTQARRN